MEWLGIDWYVDYGDSDSIFGRFCPVLLWTLPSNVQEKHNPQDPQDYIYYLDYYVDCFYYHYYCYVVGCWCY